MLVLIASFLEDYIGFFRIFSYSTFRAVIASLTSLFICLFLGPMVIRKLKYLKVGQVVRNDGPQTHLAKTGTPTMGGVLIIISIAISSLLWVKLNNMYFWLLLIVMLSVGALGFYDDWRKIVLNDPNGVSGKIKILFQSVVALFVGLYLYIFNGDNILLFSVPFLKNFAYPLGMFGFLILTYFVIVGTSNAVNLTDGLDGLTTLPIVFVALGLSVFAYVSGNIEFAKYLQIQYIPGVGEVMIFGAIVCGACLGFLWWNAHPAEVFMGDVGSLSLGALLGTIAVIVRQEIVLFIMGFIFVLEAVSVMLQVGFYKLTKKRIFLMAPLHHHFEQKGWNENKVVVRFWIISIILMLIGLATLKIR